MAPSPVFRAFAYRVDADPWLPDVTVQLDPSPDVATLVRVALIAAVVVVVGGVWVLTVVRARSERRLQTELVGRVRRATARNRTAVLVTIAGLIAVTLLLVWHFVATLR